MKPAPSLRFFPSMAFLIAGIVFAVVRLLATSGPTPIVGIDLPRGHYILFSWLGVGVLVCFLYAVIYYLIAKLLRGSISFGLSLLHLLITLSAVIGLSQLHFIGVRTDQSPTSYNPALAFLGAHAFRLLVFGGLLFLAIIAGSWILKRSATSP
jgi:ribose/xylose/arabinose/galactoside ABC-type transport system permease subunit